jgi:hypothetical protein
MLPALAMSRASRLYGQAAIIRKEAKGNGAGTGQSPSLDEPGTRYGVGVPAGGVAGVPMSFPAR